MKWTPILTFTAPHYLNESLNQIQRCVNWYHEKVGDDYVLMSLQGFHAVAVTGNNLACRGAFFYEKDGGVGFSCHGNKIYWIASNGAATAYATTLSTISGDVYFAANSTTVLVTDGSYGYIINPSALSITKITDVNFPAGPGPCAYMNGRLIVLDQGNGTFHISQLNDGLTWTPSVFATAEAAPDVLNGIARARDILYLLGETTTEPWVGMDADPYFQPVVGSVMPVGCLYGPSVAQINDKILFFGAGHGRTGTVFMIQGVVAQDICPSYIADKIALWSAGSTTAYAYTNQGHEIYEIKNTAVSQFTSWIYDITSGVWSESNLSARSLKTVINAYSGSGLPPFGFDNANGNIYWLGNFSNPYNSFNGTAITRILDFALDGGISRTTNQGLRFDLEVQHDSSASYTLSATLQKSDDSGLTFDTGITLSKAITSGTTAQQVVLTTPPLGAFKAGRIYRLTFTGPSARLILRRCEGIVRIGRF